MAHAQYDFSGKVAVITGGSHGIGRGVAEGIGTCGATVVVVDIDNESAHDVAKSVKQGGGTALVFSCDVTDSRAVNDCFRQIVDATQRIDILVNSAGGFTRKLTIDATADDEWDRIVNLNLKSAFLCTRAAFPVFAQQQSGAIVNIGSVAGLVGSAGVSAPYAAAKAGVHQFTRTTAAELAKYGVRANAVLPGTTATERVNKLHGDEFMRNRGASVPLGRIAEVDDIVGAILFLASKDAGYITGKSLTIDGGANMT